MTYAGKIYRDYFTEKLGATVAVSKDVPAIRSRKQVQVTTTVASGHDKPEQFQWSRIVVRCWATDEDTTSDLAQAVRYWAIKSKRLLAGVHRVVMVGEPGRYDDPFDTSPRFQLTFDALFKVRVSESFPAAT